MKGLKDLINKEVKLTFRSKSISQYKAYNILDYKDGFFQLQGIQGDAGKLGEGVWWQNLQEIDCISDVKPTVEQPTVKPTAKVPVKAEIPAKQVSSKPGPSRNKLL